MNMSVNEIRVEHNDFIAVYHNVFPAGYCKHIINEFERLISVGAGGNRQRMDGVPKHKKDDYNIGFTIHAHNLKKFEDKCSVDMFFKGLQTCYEEYTDQYSILKDDIVLATHMKVQRSDPGAGYHLWHAEQGNGPNSSRVLVYMLYLNSLAENAAGETEFLYQKRRIRPKENTMVLWPAAYTHAHRGNVVHGYESKYIATGWFYHEP